MKITELKERKKELGYTNEKVAELSGVPLSTVQKVLGGTTSSPRLETLRALERALFPERRALTIDADDVHTMSYVDVIRDSSLDKPLVLRETIPDFDYSGHYSWENELYGNKRQGEYTIEDYFALPDNVRAELIDGRLYFMAAPTYIHQYIVGDVYSAMSAFRKEHGGSCLPLMSPLDVQLDRDDDTMVQPDVVIVCDKSKFQDGRVFGAPDFVLEVVLPSTRQRDLIIKLNKYWQADVREYWTVDPVAETVTVYRFSDGAKPADYTFEDRIPVGIWDNKLEIDFADIQQNINLFFRK